MCFFLLKKPHDFFVRITWFCILRGLSLLMTEATSRGGSCVLSPERWVQLSLPPPFGFTLVFSFYFLFVCLLCFLYMFCLWRLKVQWSHLHTQSLISHFLAPAFCKGRFSCLKRKTLPCGVESCGQTSFGWRFQPGLLRDTQLSWIWLFPWARRFPCWGVQNWGRIECHHCSMPMNVWHRMSPALFGVRKAVCVVASYQMLKYRIFNKRYFFPPFNSTILS